MNRTEHHFVFTSDRKQLELFWDGQHTGGKFCADLTGSFEYLENLFNMNRSTKCRGSETLMKANYKVTFYDNVDVSLMIPPFSGEGSTSSGETKSNPKDGQICSAFGLCLKWPP
jgi:hypothetical protein